MSAHVRDVLSMLSNMSDLTLHLPAKWNRFFARACKLCARTTSPLCAHVTSLSISFPALPIVGHCPVLKKLMLYVTRKDVHEFEDWNELEHAIVKLPPLTELGVQCHGQQVTARSVARTYRHPSPSRESCALTAFPGIVKHQKDLVRLHLDVHFHDSLLVSSAFMFQTFRPFAKSARRE